MKKTLLLLVAVSIAVFSGQASATPLDDYVNAPDPTYSWKLVSSYKSRGFSMYYINMTSQTWLSPQDSSRSVWFHWLGICVPEKLSGFDTATLFIQGGGNNNFNTPPTLDELSEILCVSSGLVTAVLGQIPNAPIVFPGDPSKKSRVEDAIIAYTWAHFLNDTSNPYWLARMPMTKAAVRALDTIQAFTASLAGVPKINNFAVLGASKRGWTTWTTAAVDARVKLFIPMVIPVLDLINSMERLFQPYGSWSFAIGDYATEGITKRLQTPEMQQLAAIVDPISYNQRYASKLKYVICAAGDEFFLPDSANVFWSRLTGQKYLRIVPNVDHSLIPLQTDITLSVDTFIQMHLHNEPGPIFTWKMQYSNSTASIVANIPEQQPGSAKLQGVYLWYSNTLSTKQRDYRLITCPSPNCFNPVIWHYVPLQPQSPGVYVATQNKPVVGWQAFLVEAVFSFTWPNDELNPSRQLRLTTEVNVVPNEMPFPPCAVTNSC